MQPSLSVFLSEPRFGTYLRSCNDDPDRALSLYIDNMRVSGAALEAIHVFEVTLRNAIDIQLRTWNARSQGTPNWTTQPGGLIRGIFNDSETLDRAKADARRALRNRREPTHDDIVAQLSLGTWRYLLPSNRNLAKQQLWDEALENAFPRRGQVQLTVLIDWIQMVYDLRNRVAHFEPIFSNDLRGRRKAIRDVLNAIDGDVRKWFLQHDRFLVEIERFYQEWPQWKDG